MTYGVDGDAVGDVMEVVDIIEVARKVTTKRMNLPVIAGKTTMSMGNTANTMTSITLKRSGKGTGKSALIMKKKLEELQWIQL
jgi:hypothetical protein